MRRNWLPISFLWRITQREAPITPPRTVSLSRLRRAFTRKTCSFRSFTFRSSERSRTVYAPASEPGGTGVDSAGGAPVGVGVGAAGGAPEGTGAGAGAAVVAGAAAAGAAAGAPV